MNVPRRLLAYYGVPLTGKAVSHIAISLAIGMHGKYFSTQLFGLTKMSSAPSIKAPPKLLSRLLWRVGLSPRPLAEALFLTQLRASDVAYLWPGTSLNLYKRVKRKKCIIVNERINCHRSTANKLLQSAYDHADIPFTCHFPEESVRIESRKLAMSDFVFSPSPMVSASLNGIISSRKILESSYGYCPNRISAGKERAERSSLNFLFLGRGCVRKGIHTLLKAWSQKTFDATLTIAGNVDHEIKERYRSFLERTDVKQIGHVEDVQEVLSNADIFVFPTYEEGSPLVIYEAAATGLPIITTPMGAGSVIRSEQEGVITQPGDVDGLLLAMSELACDHTIRTRLGAAGRDRVAGYTWAKVAEHRAKLLADSICESESYLQGEAK